MNKINTEILVIGGGATGAGVVRDLAMRGFKAVMVEKGDLTHGTTGRYHGLLHSGGRYAVKDPLAAKECIEENRILRRIMPHCIEDTGGFFVVTPWDDPAYGQRFVSGCEVAGIPVEEVPIDQMLREEPLLNPQLIRCFRVPDGSADSFLSADATAESARQYGAVVLNYHKVITLTTADGSRQTAGEGTSGLQSAVGSRITGARVLDLVKDEEIEIEADLVVNAAGAWAGQIAAFAGVQVEIIPGKGTMVAVNHRIVNTIINRCRLPGDGDILVPAHTVAVMGTTDIKVDDPDHYAIEPWEVQLMLDEGEKLVPGFKGMRMLRAWAGVRPLYRETKTAEGSGNRDVTRAFVLLDHAQRDGVEGLVTITSGKWTTHRKMAEVTVDMVCAKLGVQRACRTHLEPLPGGEGHGYHWKGGRLAQVENESAYGSLVCECELATHEDVVKAITVGGAKTIDDVRRDVRLGMGPCQGGFCTFRVAGMLHEVCVHAACTHASCSPVESANVALRDFLQERWKGLLPILWGQQLRQECLDELIYLSLLNADHLPGPRESRLGPVGYEPPTDDGRRTTDVGRQNTENIVSEEPGLSSAVVHRPSSIVGRNPDLLIVGAGLAGLTAAWWALKKDGRVRVVAKGWGTNHWHAGCIDVLGYLPGSEGPVESPVDGLRRLVETSPGHPYALAGLDSIADALESFQSLCSEAGYPLLGSLERNWLLPTAVGTLRPTCLAPETMIAGDCSHAAGTPQTLIVGFERYGDFYPAWIADNLVHQGFPARGVSLELASLSQLRFVTARVLAQKFDTPEFCAEVAAALKPMLGSAERVGFPAVLGLRRPNEVMRDIEARLGIPIFEIPTLPPSIPGIRIHNLLVDTIQKRGGRVFDGMLAVGSETGAGSVNAVLTEAAALRHKVHRAERFILATGGILGGGFRTEPDGLIREEVFGLEICAPEKRSDWFQPEFLDTSGHPIYSAGVEVDSSFHPIRTGGEICYQNLYAIGSTLAHSDVLRERSLEGVALATAFAVSNRL